MRNPVSWFEIFVKDMTRAKTFYETVLAKPLTQLPVPEGGILQELWVFPAIDGAAGTTGALVKANEPYDERAGKHGGTMVYFSCVDCAVEASRVQAAGGMSCQPKFSIGEYGFIAIAQDTEGNLFGLHSLI